METVKVKTAELEGAQLDWAVAKADGSADAVIEQWSGGRVCVSSHKAFEPVPFTPSIKWHQGGPIIERERIGLYFYEHSGRWYAAVQGRPDRDGGCFDEKEFSGPTPLIAAMRAFVASKMGDEVEVPV